MLSAASDVLALEDELKSCDKRYRDYAAALSRSGSAAARAHPVGECRRFSAVALAIQNGYLKI